MTKFFSGLDERDDASKLSFSSAPKRALVARRSALLSSSEGNANEATPPEAEAEAAALLLDRVAAAAATEGKGRPR